MTDIMIEMRKKALSCPPFRKKLLATRDSSEPLLSFCAVANEYGFPLTLEEILDYGEAFSSCQTKSTNGGNPIPYECFDDPYELFLAGIK